MFCDAACVFCAGTDALLRHHSIRSDRRHAVVSRVCEAVQRTGETEGQCVSLVPLHVWICNGVCVSGGAGEQMGLLKGEDRTGGRLNLHSFLHSSLFCFKILSCYLFIFLIMCRDCLNNIQTQVKECSTINTQREDQCPLCFITKATFPSSGRAVLKVKEGIIDDGPLKNSRAAITPQLVWSELFCLY